MKRGDLNRAQFAEEGFLVVKEVLPKTMIEEVLQDANEIVCAQLKRFGIESSESLFDNMQSLLTQDVAAYLGSLRLMAKLSSVRRLTTSKEIEMVLRKLGCQTPTNSESPSFHVMSERLKIPNGYFGFDAHQDWTSIQGALDVVVCWVPLVPITPENFPLLVLPGSNQQGMLKGAIQDNVYHVEQGLIDHSAFVPALADVGDIVLMTGWTVHKSAVKGCSGFRLAVSNRWEDAQEPTFVKRNYPSAYKKYVHREWITPEFPSHEQIIDVQQKWKD